MATFQYPTTAALREIGSVFQSSRIEDDLLFSSVAVGEGRSVGPLMPIVEQDTDVIMWEQRDNYPGLQQIRGLNGAPPKVQPIGSKLYLAVPGVYGEYTPIDEKQLTQRRRLGTFATPVSIDDLVTQKAAYLVGRRLDRIRYIGWTLLATGTFSVTHPDGAPGHTDTFSLGTYDATTWATVATATPLADFRAVQLLGPAQGANFGGASVAVMNRATANNLLANTNAADLGGKRTAGLSNVLSMGQVNQLLAGEDLPLIAVYDRGYLNDAGTFTRFVPNGKVIVFGDRPPGDPVAEYIMTRNANNADLGPGAYMKVKDTYDTNDVPRLIEVHDGHNGGPAIYYPGTIVIMDVS